MNVYYLGSLIKTWIFLCIPKDKIITDLITDFSLNPQEARHMYLTCLVEMGH